MNSLEISPEIQQIMQEIDRLITEMTKLRQQVAALSRGSTSPHSIRQAEYFGMWADREDMVGRSSRAWLEELRRQQWVRQ
jgi:hypothetical protein